MTDEEFKAYLNGLGWAEHVWRDGKQGLIDRWARFVREVETGFCPNCLFEEYQNDLDIRLAIRVACLDEEVKYWDARFVAMLARHDIRVRCAEREIVDDFWNFGYPRNASGYFLREIRERFGDP